MLCQVFCCRSQEDTTFSTIKSVLLLETESCEAQLVLAWQPTHAAAFFHCYSWNINTTGQAANSKKLSCWDKKKYFYKQKCGLVAIHLVNNREQRSRPQIYKYLSTLSYFCSAGFQGQHCCSYDNKIKIWNVQVSVAQEKSAMIEKNKRLY